MKDTTGWLFDLYAHPAKGIVVWLVGEDGRRHFFRQDFEITFYAGGAFQRLRELWRFLRTQPVKLSRTQREDLYAGTRDVMEIRVASPAQYAGLFREVSLRFPELSYYDADIPLILRYGAAFGVFPLARCRATTRADGKLIGLTPLDRPSDIDPLVPHLRELRIEPDVDPGHAPPRHLLISFQRFNFCVPLDRPRELLRLLNNLLRRYDPDVILTGFGDTWLFSRLEELSAQCGIPFNPNRDLSQDVMRRKEVSFFNYGHAHYRGEQVHLFGRWHIDSRNCMTFNDYGVAGAVEQARLTGLPVQETARRSPGAGIAAMQTLTALRRGVLVPYQQQKGEVAKTYNQLFKADRGGLVFQPLIGIFPNVAILDFISMYPSLMVKYNLSPETVGVNGDDSWEIPELDVRVASRLGLVPEALRPVLEKRIAFKQLLKSLDQDDPRYHRYKSLAKALKWLLVVAYGRLGYANSTFGRINSHEAVTHLGRKVLLHAKALAEDQGFTVLHMYVDSLFIRRPDASTAADFQTLMGAIEKETGLPVDLDGLYAWMAFLPARHKTDVAVANRFFGLLPDGTYKIRGLALRREDTCAFVANTQLQILDVLAKQPDPGRLAELLPGVLDLLQQKLSALRKKEVPAQELLITQTLSREPEEYRVATPLARAAEQLRAAGGVLRMGQRVRFIYTSTEAGVFAWDLHAAPDPRSVDVLRYQELLLRAAHEILQPLGVTEAVLRGWLFGRAGYLAAPGLLVAPSHSAAPELPLFAGMDKLGSHALSL